MDETAGVEHAVEVVDGLEVQRWTPREGSGGTPVVLLHEGLGSAALWRGFPSALAAATGRPTVAWSRRGHGRSAPLRGPHGPDYMHREADALPGVLRTVLGLDRAVLVGHSDGASIALLHAAATTADAVPAVVLVAPHVVVEDRTLAGIREARRRYLATDLPRRMARHHADADALFWAWNDVWLSPAFRGWDITSVLGDVDQPVLLVQAADDEYGTFAQLDLVETHCAGRCERLVLAAGGHAPHLAAPDRVVGAVTAFLAAVGV